MIKQLNTLEGVVFFTDESNFRRVQDFLKNSHGFVNGNDWAQYKNTKWYDDTLVYEENNKGLYRCSFHRPENFTVNSGPNLEFKYWEDRLSTEQLAQDPMRTVVIEVYEMLKPVRVTNYAIEEIVIDV